MKAATWPLEHARPRIAQRSPDAALLCNYNREKRVWGLGPGARGPGARASGASPRTPGLAPGTKARILLPPALVGRV